MRVLAAFFTPGVELYVARRSIQKHSSRSIPPILPPIMVSLRRCLDMGLRRGGVLGIVGCSGALSIRHLPYVHFMDGFGLVNPFTERSEARSGD